MQLFRDQESSHEVLLLAYQDDLEGHLAVQAFRASPFPEKFLIPPGDLSKGLSSIKYVLYLRLDQPQACPAAYWLRYEPVDYNYVTKYRLYPVTPASLQAFAKAPRESGVRVYYSEQPRNSGRILAVTRGSLLETVEGVRQQGRTLAILFYSGSEASRF